MMRLTRHAVTIIARWHGTNTAHFEHDAEWELQERILALGKTDAEIAELNRLAEKVEQ